MRESVEGMGPTAQLAVLLLSLTGAMLVLLIAGTALFYGGIGGRARAGRTLGIAFATMAVVVLLWIAYGYGAAFGAPLIPHGLGDPLSHAGLTGLSGYQLAFAGFQSLVAVFAVVLILGSRQGLVRGGPWIAFVVLWVSLVYLPVAYGIFNDIDGWGGALLQVNDFSGGIAVQVSAGAAALAVALAVRAGPRTRNPEHVNPTILLRTPLTLAGAAAIWFGWIGLDVGSEAAVDGVAALAWVNTLVAPAAGMLTWLVVQAIREKKPTATGAAFGAIAGCAAVSAGCNDIAPGWAVLLGVAAAVPCALLVEWPPARWLCGPALPVVGIHLVGGLIGTLYVGLFGAEIGLVDTGNFNQLVAQAFAALAVMLYSFAVTWIIAFALERTVGLGQEAHPVGPRSRPARARSGRAQTRSKRARASSGRADDPDAGRVLRP